MEQQHNQLVGMIKATRKKLKPSSSFDSEFWSSKADLLSMDSKRVELYISLQFHKYQDEGGKLSREQWEDTDPKARECLLESIALARQAKIARAQADKMKGSHFQGIHSAFVKLFNSSKLGLEKAVSKGQQEASDQSTMRDLMKQAYCPSQSNIIWEPVLGTWIDSRYVVAAHLFPWRSADLMGSIFGTGARDELFSNGIFLDPAIEKAFARGFLALVPDAKVEPENPLAPWEDEEERHKALKEWEMTHPREYRVAVLDATPHCMKEPVFAKKIYGLESETLAGLHGRRLTFLNDARPKARYVWWTFLGAVTQLTWKGSVTNPDSLIQKEVLKRTRYWGTHGKYVKKNMLLGFVQELGHDVGSIAESIMEHAIEDGGPVDPEPDPSGLAIVADQVVRQTQEHDGFDYEDEPEGEDEDEDEDGDGDGDKDKYDRHDR
ncbi:hypothetical protein B0T25DRAFT_517471 [Lasiosphaeria hispida]|uniref:HNH nuclease domain-containing protein n=1 Tax=Lasiosphaeria hispida TaxID=260671 RepID=A0AAJ0MGV9_9PEZI|nr:hypothetical protein B0T25DRAFT_517471 [Lasiosphaeria hispida]